MKTLVLLLGVLVLAIASCDVPLPNGTPEVSRCTMSAGLSCTDFVIDDGELTLVLRNGLGREIEIQEIGYQVHDASEPACTQADVGTVANGQTIPITFGGCTAEHDTRYTIKIAYLPSGSTIPEPRTISGELFITS